MLVEIPQLRFRLKELLVYGFVQTANDDGPPDPGPVCVAPLSKKSNHWLAPEQVERSLHLPKSSVTLEYELICNIGKVFLIFTFIVMG